jgi:hypothetical protein
MARHPVKVGTYLPREADEDSVTAVSPASARRSWFSFRYTYTEVSLRGSSAHVKAKSVRSEGGKVIRESFEGELGRDAYDRAVAESHDAFRRQASAVLDTLALFLPFARGRRSDRD